MTDLAEWKGEPQVARSHYFNPSYMSKSRFEGLQAQLMMCLEPEGLETFLEIGPGPGLLTALLHHFQYKVTTLDIAFDIRPDIVGGLPGLPLRTGAFDAVCAFQVLEHLPFSQFISSMQELKRVSRNMVFISVPNQKEILEAQIKVSLTIGKKKIQKVFWRKRLGKLTNPEEHYWEVGHNGVTPQIIIDASKKAGLTPIYSRFCSPWFQLFAFKV